MYDEYKSYFPKKTNGKVTDKILYKGGGYDLQIAEKSGDKNSIAVAKKIGETAKLNDEFFKLANTNKCIIKRGDSIIYLDCLEIEEAYKDSFPKIPEWEKNQKNKWFKDSYSASQ